MRWVILVQSYRDAGRLDAAIASDRRRADMGGWDEERWFSQLQVAMLSERLEAPPAVVREAYLLAFQARPTLAEPLCELARYHRLRGEFGLAHLFAQQAATMAAPADTLFLDGAVYAWRSLDELVVSAYYLGAIGPGCEALTLLLERGGFPESERARIVGNRRFFER